MICINSNISVRNNQAFYNDFNSTLSWMRGFTPESYDSQELLRNHRFTKNSKNILRVLLKYMGINHETYVSQELIAQKAGVHHDTVNRTLGLFAKLGIIKKKYRGANRTCIYSFGKFLHDPQVKWALKDILPNLFWAIENQVRICMTKFNLHIPVLAAIFTQDTARLSNDKNKEYKTNKNYKNLAVKEIKIELTQEELERYRHYELEEQQKKQDFAADMAKLLGL